LSKTRSPVPPRLAQALAKLGADLKNARRRRRMPMAYAADLARISRSTLHKVERGDPGVSLGIFAAVLLGYGMIERLERLVDVRWDWAGVAQQEDRMPRRIRRHRRRLGDEIIEHGRSTPASLADRPRGR
jgi:transcriptional regulator with XRE-family HTH domain